MVILRPIFEYYRTFELILKQMIFVGVDQNRVEEP
jgi:hypothetical protein